MNKWLAWIFLLAACALSTAQPENAVSPARAPETAIAPAYPDLGLAPEIVGDIWLNSDQPLRLADQRGKVVLIDMWTFG